MIVGRMATEVKRAKVCKVIDNSPPRPVELHLVVTRSSGDTECYKLGEVPDLRYVIQYRRKVSAVKMPTKLGKEWQIPKRKVAA